ncbi:hypothetical protein MBANPS3_008100 [Mucor bainieri]
MSSYTTAARPPADTNCDLENAFAMDSFFPVYAQQQQLHPPPPHQHQHQHQHQQQHQHQHQHQHQDLCNGNDKINMTQSEFDCFPQAVASLPLESLSLDQHLPQEWPLELGAGEGDEEYQADINFLFTCNELGVTASESSSSSSAIVAASAATSVTGHFQHQPSIKAAEQFRRFSLEETDTVGNLMPFFPQTPVYQNSHHKERSSMPNVFEHFAAASTTVIPQQGQLSWQQSTLLQKRPDYQPQHVISSISSPLKKHAKKRSLVDQVMNEEYMPSVVSSLSEPIPSSQQWMIRKRNKSIRHTNANKTDDHAAAAAAAVGSNSAPSPTTPTTTSVASGILNIPEYIVPSSAPMDNEMMQQQHPHHQRQDYMIASDPMLHYEDLHTPTSVSSTNDNNNQLLAAMPRRQKLRYDGDSYTPKWVRFTGHLKEGYCDSCQPGKWLQLKNSAYWYHKQFYHGISSVSGKSFMKPLEQRMGKGDMIEGLCHQCHRFVSACNGKKKNNYMLWYRHAHKCHLYDKPKATSKSVRKLSNDSTTPAISSDAATVASSSPTSPSGSTSHHPLHHYQVN